MEKSTLLTFLKNEGGVISVPKAKYGIIPKFELQLLSHTKYELLNLPLYKEYLLLSL